MRRIFQCISLATILLLSFVPLISDNIPAGLEEYIVIGREYQLRSFFRYINQQEGYNDGVISNYLDSIITLTATLDGQKIIYDHWEDGYEKYPLNPTQSTTEIYTLNKGEILSLKSDQGNVSSINGSVPTNPRGTDIRYDAGDRIISIGGPIDVAHSIWPHNETYIGGAFEAYPEKTFEGFNSYVIPFGEDSYDSDGGDFSVFKYVALEIIAFNDNTTVLLDNGSNQVTLHLNKGDIYNSLGYINDTQNSSLSIQILAGMKVTSDKTIQVSMLTGSYGRYQTRFFVVLPIKVWGKDYVAPVVSPSSYPANIYLFNPNDDSLDLTIFDKDHLDGFTFSLGPYQGTSYVSEIGNNIPAGSSVRIRGDRLFWGTVAYDYQSVMYDWGFSLIPTRILNDNITTPWSPGSEDLSGNGSPIFVVAPYPNTEIKVDLNHDGVFDEVDTDGDGNPDPGPYILGQYDYLKIYDPNDYDNTGTYIEGNNPFFAVYGEDPEVAGTSTPYLDLGYSILPITHNFLEPLLQITITPDKYSVSSYGDYVTFDTLISSGNSVPVTVETVKSWYPEGITYVISSAYIEYPDQTTTYYDPAVTTDGTNQYLLWNINREISGDEKIHVIYTLRFPSSLPDQVYTVNSTTRGIFKGVEVNPSDSVDIAKTFIRGTKEVTTSTIGVGERLTYFISVTNVSDKPSDVAQNVTIIDNLNENFAFAGCDPQCNYVDSTNSVYWAVGDLAGGDSYRAKVTVEVMPLPAGNLIINRAKITSDNLMEVYTNEVTTLVVPPEISLFKYSSADTIGEVHAGDTLTYYLVVTNVSTHPAHQVILTEGTIPTQMEMV